MPSGTMVASARRHHLAMKRFALKLLLTTRVLRRGSGRLDPAELVTWLLTVVVFVFIGVLLWVRGPY